jgi:periplasmic protein TonB
MQPMSTAEHAPRDARIYAAREVAVALAAVLALHALLALWLLREAPARVEPREVPRTIVARLLITPPAPAVAIPPRVAVPTPTHTPPPHATPETSRKIAASPQRAQPQKTPALSEKAIAPTLTSTPAPSAPATTAPPAAQPVAPPQAMRAPKPVSHVDCSIPQPDYPEAARRRGESGTAVVRFVVGVDGRVESTELLRSSGYTRLDNAALDALRSSTCHPSLDGGVPVRVVFEQPFVFGLDN